MYLHDKMKANDMLKKQPKVTVVTPTFNLIEGGREKFFQQCIESVHNQTYQNIEHLIIDGASTDGTLELLQKYEKKGWIKCYSEPDEGMCDAMNKGIRKASGEYVAILNSDDFYTKNAIELSVKALLENNADYSYATTDMISRKDESLISVWAGNPYGLSCFWFQMPFNHESMLCKKSVYDKFGGYDYKQYGTIADYDFVMKLILNDHKGIMVPEHILKFRMDGTTNYTDPKEIKESYRQHIKMLFKLYFNLWSNFISSNSLKKLKQFVKGQDGDYLTPKALAYLHQEFFLKNLMKFLVSRNLQHFPYNEFLSHIINIIYNPNEIKVRKYLSLLTIESSKNKKKIKLFGVIPLLKIRKQKQNKYYKVLGIVNLLKISRKNNFCTRRLLGIIPILKLRIK